MDEKDQLIALLKEENRLLKERIFELERRLGIDSSTSSKPPSSDGLGKKPKRPSLSSRESLHPKGGQKGHQGRTMEAVEVPDEIIVHPVQVCATCQADLSQSQAARTVKRQVFDVKIHRFVTEHQAEVKVCSCGACTTAPFPEDVKAPVQIGKTLKGIALYLSEQFIAKDRLSDVMEDLFSIPISDTTLLKYEAQLSHNLKGFYEETFERLRQAVVKHADETGMRVSGQTQWIHVLSNHEMTYLWHHSGRKCLLEGLSGVLVHDHYRSYLQLKTVQDAFCNAHHLRELQALMVYEKEEWAGDLHKLFKIMCHAKNEESLCEGKVTFFTRIYDKVLERGLRYHESLASLGGSPQKRGRTKRRVGHNLALRLLEFKAGVLLFLTDSRVPFTNNQAEQDLRFVKLKQKVSGGFRTQDGVKNFAVIRSFIGTMRKNGFNILDAIKMALLGPVKLSDVLPLYKAGLPALIPTP